MILVLSAKCQEVLDLLAQEGGTVRSTDFYRKHLQPGGNTFAGQVVWLRRNGLVEPVDPEDRRRIKLTHSGWAATTGGQGK